MCTADAPATPSTEIPGAPRGIIRHMAIHDPSAGLGRADTAPPRERRTRTPWVRLLVALTSSTALLGTAGLVAAAAIVPPIGARRTAREAAQQEVASQLEPDERVVAQAFASQRRWTDMWRESFGVVVATNRRLLYVGAPPTPLLRPREDGPTEVLVESYPYDVAFTLEPRTLFRGYGRGLVLRTPATEVDFIVDDGAWTAARRVAQASAAARQAVTRDEDALTATTRAPAPPAARYESYVVRRGETLTALARRFQTSPDVLRQLNQLSADEIQVGQRLRVPAVDVDSLP
jgi:LysM repeat protein